MSGCSSNVVEPSSQHQPVIVATPTSSPVPIVTAKSSPTPQAKSFSKLHLLKPVYNGRKVTVHGLTDLPDGAEVDVSFKVAGRSDTDIYLGVDDKVQVLDSKFTTELTVPDRPAYGSGRYEVSALFTPRGQSPDVLAQVGVDGEKLRGAQVEKTFGFRMLNDNRLSRHRLKLTSTHYVMVKPSDYESGSAERAFAEFLVAWKQKDWGIMADVSQKTWKSSEDDAADSVKNIFDIKDLLEAKIIKASDVSDLTPDGQNAKDITAKIRYSVGSEAGVMGFQMHTETVTARVIRESAPYKPDSNGEWGVNPSSLSVSRDE